jgi:thiaminase/transcriptional activator TenA
VDTYADPGFAALTRRCAQMLDEAAPAQDRAAELFLDGMRHEIAFWDVPL